MSLKSRACCVGLTMAMLVPTARALDIGDPAPALQIDSWIKGGPVDLSKDKGKIFVIEFWATWCGPCLQTIPHLTELQKQYKDKGVVMVGITDEPAAVAKPFVEKMGDKMDYVVAADKRKATGRAYLGGVGAEGIPYAFVIDKTGAIAWHGHPLGGLDRVLDRIVAGKFDVNVAKQEAAASKMAEQYLQLVEQWNATQDEAQRKQIDEKAKALGQKILEQASRSPDFLNEFAGTIILLPGTDYRDLELAARASDAAFKASEQKQADKSRKLFNDYFLTLEAKDQGNKKQKLDEITSQILTTAEPAELSAFAWTIMDAPAIKQRDLQLAVKSSQKAVDATKGQDPAALTAYARALFETGQKDKAVETMKKAVEVNKDERMAPALKQNLEKFEKAASSKPA